MEIRRISVVVFALVALIAAILFLNNNQTASVKIGVIEPMAHIAVSDITQGILQEINGNDKHKIEVLVRNASGDKTLIPQIVSQYRDQDVDIYVPIFTSTSQIAASTIKHKPIVFAAVTDPVAAGVIKNSKSPQSNVTGVSDLWPIDAQFQLIKRLQPAIKTIGILFDPNDPSSSITMPLVRSSADKYKIVLLEKPVSSATGIAEALPSLDGKVDALFTANDTTVTQSLPALVVFSIQNKIPLYAGDYSSVKRGAISAVGQSYEGVGREAGEMIIAILDGQLVSDLPVRYTDGGDIYINAEAARKMNVKIPSGVLNKAKQVYETIE
ncbi:MAG: ABC transporter substrate-binding protein [Candidatus Thiodiazotropha sp.]